MHIMSVDTVFMYWGSRWISLFFSCRDVDGFCVFCCSIFVPGHGGSARGQGHPKHDQTNADTRGDL